MARFSSIIATVALALSSVTTATPLPVATSTEYDVLIVGGGPAGLSALSGLARVRRNVLMLDSGEYRNAATRHMHDVIGNDGTVPATFRALAREQISRYPTATMKNATVSSITGGNGSVFTATDSTGQVYTAKKVVLATGMKDILPQTPGIDEAWANGLFWCPWCDGYEHRDQEFGIIGSLKSVLSTVQEVDTLNKDIIAFVNGTYTDDVVAALNNGTEPLWREKIEAYGVKIENRTISSIGRTQDGAVVKSEDGTSELDRFVVTFEDGETVKRSAFISNFPAAQRSSLGADLGVPLSDEKLVVNTKSMQSDVPGVYVIGDANNDGSTNVPHAMFSGKRAAVFVHVQLEREHSNEMVANLKRSEADWDAKADQLMGRDLESLWNEIDGTTHA